MRWWRLYSSEWVRAEATRWRGRWLWCSGCCRACRSGGQVGAPAAAGASGGGGGGGGASVGEGAERGIEEAYPLGGVGACCWYCCWKATDFLREGFGERERCPRKYCS